MTVTFTDAGWEAWREIVAGLRPAPKPHHTVRGSIDPETGNKKVSKISGTIPYGDAQRTQLRFRLCELRARGMADFPREGISTKTLTSLISKAKRENSQ